MYSLWPCFRHHCLYVVFQSSFFEGLRLDSAAFRLVKQRNMGIRLHPLR